MGKFKDLTGKKFGRLTVISKVQSSKIKGKTAWYCICECGGSTVVRSTCLTSGGTKSCGCFRRELGHNKGKHHSCSTRLYRIWSGIKQRTSPNNPQHFGCYKDVYLCKEWESFVVFQKWSLENGYTDQLTIDRVDNHKGYNPNNCRWVDKHIQSLNRCTSYKIDGEYLYDIWEKGDKIVDYRCFRNRVIYLGWDITKAGSKPKIEKRRKEVL
jgi:hypothetical protein